MNMPAFFDDELNVMVSNFRRRDRPKGTVP